MWSSREENTVWTLRPRAEACGREDHSLQFLSHLSFSEGMGLGAVRGKIGLSREAGKLGKGLEME